MTADATAMLQAFQQVHANFERLSGTLEKIGQKTQDAHDRSETMIKGWIGGLGQAAAGMMGVGTALAAAGAAVRVIRAEYDAMIARQSQAAKFQTGAAAGREEAFIAGVSNETMTRLAGRFTEARAIPAVTAAVRTRGTVSQQVAERAAEVALGARKGLSGEQAGTLAGGAVDLIEAFGGTPEQQLGMIRAGSRAAAMGEVEFAQAIPGIAAGASGFGLSNQRDLFALVAGISQRSEDSGMAASVLPKLGKQLSVLTGKNDFMANLAAVRGNPALQQELLGGLAEGEGLDLEGVTAKAKLGGRGNQWAIMAELIASGDTETKRAVSRAAAGMPSLGQAGAMLSADTAALGGVEFQGVGGQQQAGAAIIERLRSGGAEGRAGLTREQAMEALGAAGFSAVQQKAWAWNPAQSWEEAVAEGASLRRRPAVAGTFGMVRRDPTAEESRQAELLEALLEEMRKPREITIKNDNRQVQAADHPAAAAFGN